MPSSPAVAGVARVPFHQRPPRKRNWFNLRTPSPIKRKESTMMTPNLKLIDSIIYSPQPSQDSLDDRKLPPAHKPRAAKRGQHPPNQFSQTRSSFPPRPRPPPLANKRVLHRLGAAESAYHCSRTLSPTYRTEPRRPPGGQPPKENRASGQKKWWQSGHVGLPNQELPGVSTTRRKSTATERKIEKKPGSPAAASKESYMQKRTSRQCEELQRQKEYVLQNQMGPKAASAQERAAGDRSVQHVGSSLPAFPLNGSSLRTPAALAVDALSNGRVASAKQQHAHAITQVPLSSQTLCQEKTEHDVKPSLLEAISAQHPTGVDMVSAPGDEEVPWKECSRGGVKASMLSEAQSDSSSLTKLFSEMELAGAVSTEMKAKESVITKELGESGGESLTDSMTSSSPHSEQEDDESYASSPSVRKDNSLLQLSQSLTSLLSSLKKEGAKKNLPNKRSRRCDEASIEYSGEAPSLGTTDGRDGSSVRSSWTRTTSKSSKRHCDITQSGNLIDPTFSYSSASSTVNHPDLADKISLKDSQSWDVERGDKGSRTRQGSCVSELAFESDHDNSRKRHGSSALESQPVLTTGTENASPTAALASAASKVSGAKHLLSKSISTESGVSIKADAPRKEDLDLLDKLVLRAQIQRNISLEYSFSNSERSEHWVSSSSAHSIISSELS